MTDVLDVYNMALEQSGARTTMLTEAETTPEGNAIRRWYAPVKDHALRAVHWNFARTEENLVLDEEITGPPWSFKHESPEDMLSARYIEKGYPAFVVAKRKILSNVETPRLIYTQQVTNPDLFDPSFLIAVSYALAAAVTYPLTGDRAMASQLFQMANAHLLSARNLNFEEAISVTMAEYTPDWIAIRDGSITPNSPFIIGVGPLFAELATGE